MSKTYDDLKARLGIRPAPRSPTWSFDPDYVGSIKADAEYIRGPLRIEKPPITEDLSHLAANDRVISSAKRYWDNLTPAERHREVEKRRRNGKLLASRRKKLGNNTKDGAVPGLRVPSDRKHARKRAGSLS